MHRFRFKSESGDIQAVVTCPDAVVPREVFEKCISSVLSHAATHLQTYNAEPKLFQLISVKRYEFLREVIRMIISTADETGQKIPQKVRDYIMEGVRKEWEPQPEDDSSESH